MVGKPEDPARKITARASLAPAVLEGGAYGINALC